LPGILKIWFDARMLLVISTLFIEKMQMRDGLIVIVCLLSETRWIMECMNGSDHTNLVRKASLRIPTEWNKSFPRRKLSEQRQLNHSAINIPSQQSHFFTVQSVPR
jgi:hypothetical protein